MVSPLGVTFRFSEELWPGILCIQFVARHILRVERERAPSPVESLTSDARSLARFSLAELTTG